MPAIAIAIFIIGRVGQKWLFCATFFCAGLACLCATFVEGQQHLMWLKITFVMVGKLMVLINYLLRDKVEYGNKNDVVGDSLRSQVLLHTLIIILK